MDHIKHKLLVMSGKGGVGKTTIAVNLAFSLAKKGLDVGLLDVDLHGPNVPKMTGTTGKRPEMLGDKIMPVTTKQGIEVISIAFMMNANDAVIWRGPLKHNLIRQFIEDVDWSALDYLIIDFPPGTGDEAISVSQLIKGITGSIIVSTPQEVALLDAKKAIDFSRKVNVPIIGLVENMSGEIFGEGGVEKLAEKEGLDFLGKIPLNIKIRESGDTGIPTESDIFEAISKKIQKVK